MQGVTLEAAMPCGFAAATRLMAPHLQRDVITYLEWGFFLRIFGSARCILPARSGCGPGVGRVEDPRMGVCQCEKPN